MDPLFLNLSLPQQAVAATSTPPVANQVNGLPQESKLATYISVSCDCFVAFWCKLLKTYLWILSPSVCILCQCPPSYPLEPIVPTYIHRSTYSIEGPLSGSCVNPASCPAVARLENSRNDLSLLCYKISLNKKLLKMPDASPHITSSNIHWQSLCMHFCLPLPALIDCHATGYLASFYSVSSNPLSKISSLICSIHTNIKQP